MPEPNLHTVGTRIAQLRYARRLTVEGFARELRLNPKTVLCYEREEKPLPRFVVVAIAYVYQYHEEWLLTGLTWLWLVLLLLHSSLAEQRGG